MKKEDWIKIEGPKSLPKLGERVLVRHVKHNNFIEIAHLVKNCYGFEFQPDSCCTNPEPFSDFTHWKEIRGPR